MATFRTQLILAAAAGSAALLLGAFAFQHLGGIAPCKLCLWQRWPHAAAIVIGGLALWQPGRLLPLLGALAALTSAAIGVYHSGIERTWWQGPDSCTSGPITDLTPQQLMDQIMSAPLVRCDDIPWELFGVTMANWNVLASTGFAMLWLLAATQSRRG